MVGDVGGKVGGDAVGADQNLVLGFLLGAVVGLLLVGDAVLGAVLGALVHDGAVLSLVAGALVQQQLDDVLHRTALVEGALMEPDVVLDAVLAQIALEAGDVLGQGVGGDGLFQLLKVGVGVAVAVDGSKLLGALDDVGALVALLGQGAGLLTLVQLQIADGQALAELLDLIARVVDVELTGHIVARPVQAGGQAVAQGAAAGIAHVHGAGGVGGDKLHIIFLALAGIGAAVILACAGGAQHRGEPAVAQEEVDEAGACNLHAGKEAAVQIEGGNHSLSDLARRLVEGTGAHHGKVGGNVAVFGVGGDLDDEIRQLGLGQGTALHGGAGGLGQQVAGGVQRSLAGVVVAVIGHEKRSPFAVFTILYDVFASRDTVRFRLGQGSHMNVHQIAADEVLAARIQGVAEFDPAAVPAQLVLDLVGGDAQGYGAVAGLVVAEMPGAFLDDQLALGLAVAHHGHPAGILRDLDGGGAAVVAGGLRLLIYDIEVSVPLQKAAVGHQFHALAASVLLHGAFDRDQIIFFHLLFTCLC